MGLDGLPRHPVLIPRLLRFRIIAHLAHRLITAGSRVISQTKFKYYDKVYQHETVPPSLAALLGLAAVPATEPAPNIR